jgi:hypothetical protein
MSARADLCGGRSEMIVPTATSSRLIPNRDWNPGNDSLIASLQFPVP